MNKLLLLALVVCIVACNNDDSVPNQGLLLEVQGVDLDLTYAQATLQNADTIIKSTMTYDLAGKQLKTNINVIPAGTYELTLSLFAGEDIYADYEDARGSLFEGIETLVELEVSGERQEVTVEGPDAVEETFDIEPTWSDRYFHVFDDPDVATLTASFPANRCEVDIRFIPDYVVEQPEYSYIDYFVYSNADGGQSLGFSECLANCDVQGHIKSFSTEVVEESDIQLCENNNWLMTDTIIMLMFGDGEDDFVIFYQRWDENGNLVIPAVREETGRLSQEYDNGFRPVF